MTCWSPSPLRHSPIILTFGTTGAINRSALLQESRLTALMGMGRVEQFTRDHEDIGKESDSRKPDMDADSVAADLSFARQLDGLLRVTKRAEGIQGSAVTASGAAER